MCVNRKDVSYYGGSRFEAENKVIISEPRELWNAQNIDRQNCNTRDIGLSFTLKIDKYSVSVYCISE